MRLAAKLSPPKCDVVRLRRLLLRLPGIWEVPSNARRSPLLRPCSSGFVQVDAVRLRLRLPDRLLASELDMDSPVQRDVRLGISHPMRCTHARSSRRVWNNVGRLQAFGSLITRVRSATTIGYFLFHATERVPRLTPFYADEREGVRWSTHRRKKGGAAAAAHLLLPLLYHTLPLLLAHRPLEVVAVVQLLRQLVTLQCN